MTRITESVSSHALTGYRLIHRKDWRLSSIQVRRPVEHHDERRCARFFNARHEQELPGVGRQGVVAANRPDAPQIKERFGRAGLETCATLHLNGHQLPVGGDVEQLFPVTAPPRLVAAFGRDLPPALRILKSLDVNLVTS